MSMEASEFVLSVVMFCTERGRRECLPSQPSRLLQGYLERTGEGVYGVACSTSPSYHSAQLLLRRVVHVTLIFVHVMVIARECRSIRLVQSEASNTP